jgi:hypothetical protein
MGGEEICVRKRNGKRKKMKNGKKRNGKKMNI